MSLWSEKEVEFLRLNEGLLDKGDYDEFYIRAYYQLGSDVSHRLMLGVFLVSLEQDFDFILEVSKDSVSSMIVDYELYLVGPKLAGSISICSSRMSGNPDDFSILSQCKKVLRLLKFDESTIRKLLDRVKVKRV